MLMRLAAVSLLMVSFLSAKADGEVLTIEGQYQNKNLYVSNSVTSSGVGFCAYEVRVNGELTTDEVNSSAFEIDLTQLQLKQGDMVTIQIWHRGGCSPKVLNPMVLRPQATFEVTNIELSEDGLLTWKTINESGSLPFNIEVYKWNKWVKVGEVQGKGSAGENSYDFKLTLISGENKVRVTQKGNMGKIAQSKAVFVTSKVEKPSWKLDDSKRKITLSANSAYEIFDKYGQARIRGYGNTIDISSLGTDEYYLCYDNVVENFRKE